jgi:hypothetical protein
MSKPAPIYRKRDPGKGQPLYRPRDPRGGPSGDPLGNLHYFGKEASPTGPGWDPLGKGPVCAAEHAPLHPPGGRKMGPGQLGRRCRNRPCRGRCFLTGCPKRQGRQAPGVSGSAPASTRCGGGARGRKGVGGRRRRAWPRGFQAQHHWIRASAWARSVGGMVRPRACAVFRLIASSNLGGGSTGRSAGFAPFRILST